MPEVIRIVGCGPGGEDYLLPAAREAVSGAQAIAGAPRLFALFPEFTGSRLPLEADGIDGLLDRIAVTSGIVAVLVTGDPGVFSLSAQVVTRFGRDCCRITPGISAVQVAFARLGLEWDAARILSAHAGQELPSPALLSGESNIAILAGNPVSDGEICALAAELVATHEIVVCRDLTLPEEEVVRPALQDLPACLGRGRVLLLLLHRRQAPYGL